MIYIWLVLSLLLLFLAYFFYFKPKKLCQHYVKLLRQRGYKVYELPFRPFSAPLYESLQKYFESTNDALYQFKNDLVGYDVLVGNLMNHPHLIFLNLKLGREITTVDKINIFPKMQSLIKMILMQFGEGIVFVQGLTWKNQRKLISKAFSFDFLGSLSPHIAEICDKVFDRMEDQSKKHQQGQLLNGDVFKAGINIFSSVAVSSFLGMNSFHQKIEGQSINEYAMDIGNRSIMASIDPLVLIFGSWVYKLGLKKDFRILQAKYHNLQQYTKAKLKEIRDTFERLSPQQQKSSLNLVHSLLYHSKAQDNQEHYNDQVLIHELMTFTAAGTDVTSTLFSMMLFFIKDHPDLEKRVRAEIKSNFKTKEDFNYENLKKMQLLDRIQLQSLRLQSPARGLFDRISTIDATIGDIPIKAGTALNYIPVSYFYDSNNFQDPRTFKPQRWDSKDPYMQELQNLVLLTFSGGPRSCIGKNLALLESKIAVIKFMQRYKNLKQVSERGFKSEVSYHLNTGEVTFTKVK